MKLSAFLATSLVISCASPSLFAYTTSFEPGEGYSVGYNAFDPDLGGQQGWALNDTAGTQLSFFKNYSGDTWGALGGAFSTPDVSGNLELSHSVTMPLVGASFSTDFLVSPIGSGTVDNFGWSLKSSSSDLLRIAFEPDANASKAKIVLYDSSGAHPILVNGINRNSTYNLSFSVTGSGADALYSGSISPLGGGSPLTFNGTISGGASANLTSFNADWDTTASPLTGAGTAFMAFNNLSIVPEPSSTLSLGLVALGLMVRRKRSA